MTILNQDETMIHLTAAGLTDPGKLREENEDCVWTQIYAPARQEPAGLFIVCDGMGGHMGGKYASYWAVEAVKHQFAGLFIEKDPRATVILSAEDVEKISAGELVDLRPAVGADLEELTAAAVQKANQVVQDYASHKPEEAANAGTTITLLAMHGKQACIANVGDSRTYLIRHGKVQPVTRDHSLVAGLVADGQILPEEVYTHPQRNVIYRYLGQKNPVQVDLYRQTLQRGDLVLLCSDGLWEMLQDDERMAQIVQSSRSLEAACQALVDAANAAGGEDNISVVLVKVG